MLDGFINRINFKQPLACPEDILRFFITKEEAGQICLLAAILGKSGSIFFPKLDNHNNLIPFTKFIEPLLETFGFRPEYFSDENLAISKSEIMNSQKYPVYLFKSDTSGEKLFEEFYTLEESVELNKFNSLGVILKSPEVDKGQINSLITNLNKVFKNKKSTKADLINLLKNSISNFEHLETGVNLDSKM